MDRMHCGIEDKSQQIYICSAFFLIYKKNDALWDG